MYFLIILFLAFSTLHYSQQVSNWQNYTDMKNVRSIISNGDLIWSASDGGVFSYNSVDNSYNKFSKVEGLNGTSITAVTVDQYGKIWFGSSNGIIDIYDPQTKNFENILAIFNDANKSSKVINELIAIGDTIYVSSDFGISLINASNYLFIDTFSKFGSLPSNISVNNVFISGLIYAGSDMGVVIQKQGATNLSAPESWNVYNSLNGLPSDSVSKILFFNNQLIAGTSKGLSSFDGIAWTDFTDQFDNIRISDLIVIGDSLFIISDLQNVFKYHNGVLTLIYSSPGREISEIKYSPSQGILAATLSGIYRLNDGIYLYPNGPSANLFPDLAVDNNGVLWSASGTDGTGVGFYKYNGIDWSNFNINTTPELSSNAYYNLYIDGGNTTYLGSWGKGFTIIKDGTIRNFNAANTGMQGIPIDPNYIVVGGFAKDSKNNIWVLNHGAADRKNLTKSSNLEQWFSYPVSEIDRYVDESLNLVIDEYDTKWFAVRRHKAGLFYFNERQASAPEEISDDVSGYLNEASGLN
ncbi:MAG TPA: two-component regulator propeller domain-containing protein, partial [Ignavibacteriaceae bacterium]|nr:two-component regulator propeller domain-containing protein [Ignavibacteriaceae bacterium]